MNIYIIRKYVKIMYYFNASSQINYFEIVSSEIFKDANQK